MSKHQEILDYIKSLPIGQSISVRAISNRLRVADGTAYRAIKEAENLGFVAITDRSGTVRVSGISHKSVKFLTYQEIATITDAEVLGGQAGLDRTFSHFAIAAMTMDNVKKYLTTGALVIVGDRTDIQSLALSTSNAVLVTGGLDVSRSVVALANKRGVPVMRTRFDTFTVAGRINQSLSSFLIKRQIPKVDAVYNSSARALNVNDRVGDYFDLVKATNRSRFAVVDERQKVVGVVSMRDVVSMSRSTPINHVMTADPEYVTLEQTVPNVSQRMLFDSYEMMPVVDEKGSFVGTVSKSDLLRYVQNSRDSEQSLHTFSDEITMSISKNASHYEMRVHSFMADDLGTLAYGVLLEGITAVTREALKKDEERNITLESANIHCLRAALVDTQLKLLPRVISENRRGATLDIEVYCGQDMVAKCLVAAQIN